MIHMSGHSGMTWLRLGRRIVRSNSCHDIEVVAVFVDLKWYPNDRAP